MSSIPILHLIDTFRFELFFIDFTQSDTICGLAIKQAPKLPDFTLFEGQPIFKLISVYPYFSTILATLPNFLGSFPPT